MVTVTFVQKSRFGTGVKTFAVQKSRFGTDLLPAGYSVEIGSYQKTLILKAFLKMRFFRQA